MPLPLLPVVIFFIKFAVASFYSLLDIVTLNFILTFKQVFCIISLRGDNMHNVSFLKCSDGSIRVRFFKNHIFDHEYHKPKPIEWLETPFFESKWSYDHCLGYELPSDEEIERKKEESLRCSVSRSRNKIFRIALSGKFKYFATFTFNPSFVNRYSYDDCCSILQGWLHRLVGVQYLVVPEFHKDGAIHFHGLFSDIQGLYYVGHFKIGDVFHCSSIDFGFHSFVPIRSFIRVSRYITKYITKELVSSCMFRRRYWYSYSLITLKDDLRYLVQKSQWEDFIQAVKNKSGVFLNECKVNFLEYDEVWIDSDHCSFFNDFFETDTC